MPPADAYNTTLSAQLQAQLVFSLASLEGINAARLQYAADQISYEEAVGRIDRDVRKLFYTVILLENQIAVAEQSLATAEETLTQTQTEFRSGLVAEINVRQAEVALENRRLALQRQETAYEDTLASFRQLLAVDEDTPIELVGTIAVQPTVEPDQLAAENSLTDRWDVRSVEAQIAALQSANLAQRRLARTPTLTFGASWLPAVADPFNPDNSANDGWSEWNDRGSLSVTLAIPVDNFLPFSSDAVGLAANDDAVLRLAIQRENVLDVARSEVDSLIRQIRSSEVAIESLELGLQLAEELYELTLDAYRQGATDLLAVQEADDDLEEARYDLLSEQFTLLSTIIDLEYALNTPIRAR